MPGQAGNAITRINFPAATLLAAAMQALDGNRALGTDVVAPEEIKAGVSHFVASKAPISVL